MGNGNQFVYRFLLVTIVLAPLPFAGNRPWAWSLLALVVGANSCLWGWRLIQDKARPTIPLSRVAVPASLFFVVCIFAILQTVPLDMPEFPNQYWIVAQQEGVENIRPTISISPIATWTALMRLVTYGMVFWLMLQTCRQARRAQQAVLTFGLSAAAYAFYGIVATLSGSESILWFNKWAYGDSVTGTFINRNSFATFLGLGLLCTVTNLSQRLLPQEHENAALAPDILSKGVPIDLILAVVAIMCLLAALVLTQSRAGVMVSMLAVSVFWLGIGVRMRRLRALARLATGGVLLLFAIIFFISGEGLEYRLSRLIWSDADLLVRAQVYGATFSAIQDHPLLGLGYGTFGDGFKIYRSAETREYFDKAHNTYLELAMELGIPVAAALVSSVVMMAILCLRGWVRRRRMSLYPWLGFCSTVLVGLHALVDFSLQIPAVAIQYASILAIGCAQSWSVRIDATRVDRAS